MLSPCRSSNDPAKISYTELLRCVLAQYRPADAEWANFC